MDVRFSFEHMDHNELYVPLSYSVGQFDFEHRWNPHPRHEIVWGLTYRNANYHLTPTRSFNFQKLDWHLDIYSAFAADDVTLVKDRLHLILGIHAGHNEMSGMEYQPTVRLLWTPNPDYTTWAAVSRAVRTPSIIDRGNNAAIFIFDIAPGLPGVYRNLGSPDFRSEPMMSYELGQRLEIRKNLSLDGSAFLSTYQREGSYVSKDPVFVPPQGGDPGYLNFLSVYENALHGKIFGTETSVVWSPSDRWRLLGGYSWLRQRLTWRPGFTGFAYGDNPSQQFQVRSQLDLTRKIQFDIGTYFYGSTPSTGIGRYLRGDARLGWRPTDRLEFNVGVRNALDPQHPEQYAVRYFQAFQVRRNVYGDFTWRF
jgi:iron complex outermembrane receptor protein